MKLDGDTSEGGAVRVLSLEGERLQLRCDSPYPPGSPVTLALGSTTLRARVQKCSRLAASDAEHGYALQVRLVNFSRQQREQLAGLLAAAAVSLGQGD